MPRKCLVRRIALIALCVVFVLCLACPVMAAGPPVPVDGYIYAGSHTFLESQFVADGDFWKVSSFTPSGFSKELVDTCAVSFGGDYVTLEWWSYDTDELVRLYCIGNPHFLDSALVDNGEKFLFAMNSRNKSQSFFVCNDDFYSDYVEFSGDSGFTISFAVPDATENFSLKGLMGSIGDIFSPALRMAGEVANTVISKPILYLPIIIGLCGIGVAFYRRLRQ